MQTACFLDQIDLTLASTSTSTSTMPRDRTHDRSRHASTSPSRDHSSRDKRDRHDKRRRSRSPHRDDSCKRHKTRRSRSPPKKPVELPYKAKPLSSRQYEEYEPLFRSYLDIQKQIHLDELDEREIKGRWKSFVNKWNRGELARSWYDALMLKQAQETVASYRAASASGRAERPSLVGRTGQREDDESDDDFGPAPPTHAARQTGHGPTIPRFDDLTYRNEMRDEDRARNQSDYADGMRNERKFEWKAQKERLEELAPRADPGSRERQREKKQETTSTLQSFRDAKESGEVEVAEADLMGDDGIDAYKKKKRDEERKKSEREIRREEIARARDAERNERLSERREKEAKTMDFLKQLARERFG